jgi:hypothetical protein
MAGELERVAQALCRERCARVGEPACCDGGSWPNRFCEEGGPDLGCREAAKLLAQALDEQGLAIVSRAPTEAVQRAFYSPAPQDQRWRDMVKAAEVRFA